YLEGVSLHEAQPLFDPKVDDGVSLGIFVLAEVLAGLHYAHELTDFDGRALRCVHRDVSPPNVVLTYDGGVKVIDFGVAKSTDSTFETAEGVAKGKLAYMAPENALGLTLDRRTDVFAVGAMLHRVLTGRDLWAKTADVEIARALRDGGIPRLDDAAGIHPILVSTCNRALAWHPDERFESAEAMRLPLEWYLEEHAPRVGARSLARVLEAAFGDDRRTFRAEVERLLRDAVQQSQQPSRRVASGPPESQPVTAPVRISRRSSIPPPSDTPPASSVVIAAQDRERLLSTVLHVKGIAPGARGFLDWAAASHALVREVGQGEALVIVRGRGSARDQATLAARLALMIQRRPGLCSALATSVTELAQDDKTIVGSAIDVAGKLVQRPEAAQAVVIDSLTMALLEARFVIETVDDVRLLRAARDPDDVDRLVHGREAPFLGRDDDVQLLFDAFSTVAAQRLPSVVWITGEPGIGKSRLFRELKKRLTESPFLPAIWTAAADPLAPDAPYRVVRDLVWRAIGLDLAETEAQRVAAVRDFVDERVPDDLTTEFVCELLGLRVGGDETQQLRAARRDTRLMHQQISLAFRDVVAGELARGPLVIACDDAQSIDAPSAELLRGLLDLELPLLVLAFADVPRGTRLEPARGDLIDHVLAPLPKDVTVRLAGALLPAASLQTAESLAETAAGSPLHLEELVRAYVRGAPPSAVLAMIQARLATIPDLARSVLRTASVIGGTFDGSLLSAVLPDVPVSEVSSALDLLVGRELLVERKVPTGRQLSFRNALVREAAHTLLTDADRTAIHRRVAQRLEEDDAANPLAVATHLVCAGETARAAAAFARAARASLAANDVTQTETLVASAERCQPQGEVLGELEAIRAQICHFRGKNKEIVQHAG
ncbi:MAG: AAA family ATPase, partial [Polyangiales bacterium]